MTSTICFSIQWIYCEPHKLVHPSNIDILDGVYSPPANTTLWFNVDLKFAGIKFALVKWRPSWILHTVQCLNYSLATQLSRPYHTNDSPLNREAPSILCRKVYQFIVSTLHKGRPSWSLLTIRWLMYVLAIPLCKRCLATLWYTSNLWFCYYSVKNDINFLFHLAEMTAILDCIHNAILMIFKVFSDYNTSLCEE